MEGEKKNLTLGDCDTVAPEKITEDKPSSTHARVIIIANPEAPHSYELAEVPAKVARQLFLCDHSVEPLVVEYETQIGLRRISFEAAIMSIDIQFYNKEEQERVAAEQQNAQHADIPLIAGGRKSPEPSRGKVTH